LPETVPSAENCITTLSFAPGATMRGCAILNVSVPVEPPVAEVLVVLGVEDEMTADVVEEEATMGIST
jgi:hypothetical protein